MSAAADVNSTLDADDEIQRCLSLDNPVSFFLYAGAGSGKTRSLIEAINRCLKAHRTRLSLQGQKIGVITYTNNACEEIQRRLGFDKQVSVSTIHSFIWEQIQTFQKDIKKWLLVNLEAEIAELREEQLKERKSGSKTAIDRANKIAAKEDRIQALAGITRFTYSPTGENTGKDSLNHSEVIKIGAEFISVNPTMQTLLVNRFPVLLIDESQDTNKLLIDALFSLQKKHAQRFSLGLLGDTMQRIYADGKQDLGRYPPPGWATPRKKVNYRCPRRIVELINSIRISVDDHLQEPKAGAAAGVVRLFILNSNTPNKSSMEQAISRKMAAVTGDGNWSQGGAVKTLILEHHMAAQRMGFLEMYEPLYKNEKLKIGLLDGSLSGVRLFSENVYPLIKAKRDADPYRVANVVKQRSPLLHKRTLKGEDQRIHIQEAREAVDKLWGLFEGDKDPSLLAILAVISETGLFEIPGSLLPITKRTTAEQQIASETESENEASSSSTLDAWDLFLAAPFSQIEKYVSYIDGSASFDTHQGVKGLEFERVMVIIDDGGARGFSFSYEKLFGVKDKTKTDITNEQEGKETGIDRTRRLFYVTCSRAEKSLAIVAYSDDPQKLRSHVIEQKWFSPSEIEFFS